MEKNDHINNLAAKITSEENLRNVSAICDNLFSEIFKVNAEEIVQKTHLSIDVKKKCDLLRKSLEQNGVVEDFDDEDMCNLAHEVFKIKLIRCA